MELCTKAARHPNPQHRVDVGSRLWAATDRELTAVRYLTHETEFLPVLWVLFNATFIERDQVKRCLLHLYSRDLVRRVPLPRAALRLA